MLNATSAHTTGKCIVSILMEKSLHLQNGADLILHDLTKQCTGYTIHLPCS